MPPSAPAPIEPERQVWAVSQGALYPGLQLALEVHMMTQDHIRPEPRVNDRLVVGMTSADRVRFVVFAQRAGFKSVSELARRILLAYVDEQEAKE